MLEITIPGTRLFNSQTDEFIYTSPKSIRLEHSLISVSKWEAKWKKSFISSKDKSLDEIIDYIKCMTLTQNVDSLTYKLLSKENFDEILNYIDDPMTATVITSYGENSKPKASNKITTSEEIYYWMVYFGIPFECEKWHLNRLMTLIRISMIRTQTRNGKNKMSDQEAAALRRKLNNERRQTSHTRG